MEKCFRCDRDEKEVKLVDAVYRNEIVKVCERCAITEEIPIIRRPSTSQLRDSEKAFSVYQRLKKMTKGSEPEKKPESMLDQLNRLNENPEIEAH